MPWILVKTDEPDGRRRRYVAESGSVNSYTARRENARRFPSKEAAEREACGNERAIPAEGN